MLKRSNYPHFFTSQNKLSRMKGILLVALVALVLAVGFTVAFGDDDLGAKNNELKDIADEFADDIPDDFERDYRKRYDADGKRENGSSNTKGI